MSDQNSHEHPSVATYLKIAVILTVVTAVEVALYYVPEFGLLAPTLLVLSAAKFALVVMFYMHLKPDNKLFTNIFWPPLLLATGVILALMALLGNW
ncbi:MAG: cytochrome C oxidase subunit IV family protein [Gemmatimonadota bacterium]|nr:cytochrome C oxidase subunit IV family protein [Gemmatimonadota bacterium]MDH5804716.1 cytochrome C oxidase subunit IV family protein [Gemmatimonadota bacterium]